MSSSTRKPSSQHRVTFSPTTTTVKSSFAKDESDCSSGEEGSSYEVYEETTTTSSKSTSFGNKSSGNAGIFRAAVVDGLLAPVATSRRPASPGPLNSKKSPEDILSEYVSSISSFIL